jgi:hypothetical protein
MASFTKGAGRKPCVRALALKHGLTAVNTLDSGKITKQTAKVSCITQMEIYMRESG